MRARSAIFGLKALSLVYLAGAAAFTLVMAFQQNWPLAIGARTAANIAAPQIAAAANYVGEKAVAPAIGWAARTDKAFFDWIDPPKPVMVARAPIPAKKLAPPPVLRPSVGEAPAKPSTEPSTAAPLSTHAPLELAPQASIPLTPAPDPNPPSPAELSRVLSHMKVSLTKELYANFELFLYVSKADAGPWSQRMYVFQKEQSGDLSLVYNWPVSTGREELVPNFAGQMLRTETTPGYYQLDGERMYRRYRSMQWQHPMPYAMFFSWEKDGLQTGLAIHGASGGDIALLGKRSSAGCVRLAPQNAQILFRLVRKNYRGLAPRFAYDRRTATMHNDGLLMHDASGNLKLAEGYKVLVLIENNGGDNIVAALF